MNSWAQSEGAPGLGYIIYSDEDAKGPVAKALGQEKANEIKSKLNLSNGDAVFFSCALEKEASVLAGRARERIGKEQGLIDESVFKFCWIIDFPMFVGDGNHGQNPSWIK